MFCILDSDGDGLDDDDEIALGTDPDNPDTDGDGLFDGTEVDVAEGSGCPDPLNPDSDGDNLLDGFEVTLGSDPCLADTDADGIPDDIDPFPTDPGGTQDFIETSLRDLCLAVEGLDLSLFAAPNNNARKGRRNAMCNKLNAAANATANDQLQEAIDQLTSLRAKIDGNPQPKDWMVASPQRDNLRQEVDEMIELLGLL